MEDFYNILCIKPSSSIKEIREAYRKLSKKLHPDIDPGNPELEEKFKILQLAYSTLKDPLKKKDYDTRLEAHKNRLEQIKAYAQKINQRNSATLNKKISVRPTNAKLTWLTRKGIKKKDLYHLGAALFVILISLSAIIVLERRFYHGVHQETYSEWVPASVTDSIKFTEGFHDSTSFKIKTQSSSLKKN